MGDARKADDVCRLIDIDTGAAGEVTEKVFPEPQILRNRQFRFHCVAMAEVMAGLRWTHVRFYSFAGYLYPALLGAQQAGHSAQKRGFSRAVAAGQHQRFAVT
ncbi:hypothetical protein D3C80_1796180 [compost metagenome]